ncbi:MAG: carbonic anhydrase [Acidimicrobiales bacterium]
MIAPVNDAFDDLFAGNECYAAIEHEVAESGVARGGLAIVTCIDSRIDPLAVFGLEPGDAKILRNAGARITDDVLRSLALACAALGVVRIAVVQHTDCKLASATDEELVAAVTAATGIEQPGFDPLAIPDQMAVLRRDVTAVLASPLIPDHTVVAGLLYDLRSGRLTTLVDPGTA